MNFFKANSIGLYTISRREITRFFRIWKQTLLPSVISMLLYFVIFGNLIGSRIGDMQGFDYVEYILPGLVMMAVVTNSYGNVVGSFFISRFQRNIEELLVSPLPNSIILLGYASGGVIRGVIVGILVTIVSLFFSKLHLQHCLLIFIIAFLVAILFSLLGLINAVFAKNFDDINIIPTFVLTPLTYLGGVFYSVNILPEFWQSVTYFNPIFYIVNAFRYAMLGRSDVSVALSLWIISGLVLCAYFVALWLLKKGFGIRT